MSQNYIYRITNKINGKIYIGRSKNPAYRFVRHIKISEQLDYTNSHFQAIHAAIKKYGKEKFSLDIIESCESIIANDREIFWISNLKSNNKEYGYNLTSGGDGVVNMSSESKEKLRLKMLGRSISAETRIKISESNKGKIRSEESKENISKSKLGNKNGMYEFTHSKETKDKMSKSQSARLRQPLTKEHKQRNSEMAKSQDHSFRISLEIKNEVVNLYTSGNYTKKQIAEKFNLKYNTIVKIIRSHKIKPL